VQQGRERLRQAAEGQTAQPGEVVEQTAEAMARLLTELGTRLNDFELSGLGGTLGGLPGSAPPGQAAHDGLRLLDAAARLLQRHLLAAETDRRLQLMRRTSLPPAKYRGLVEEYFKSLSETPQ